MLSKKITALKDFADQNSLVLKDQKYIAAEASKIITSRFHYNKEQIKFNFDTLLDETQSETYRISLSMNRFMEKVYSKLL